MKNKLSPKDKRRWSQIKAIIKKRKAVRFTMMGSGKWKDVKSLKQNEYGDLIAFRMSSNCWVPEVYWESEEYKLSTVDL